MDEKVSTSGALKGVDQVCSLASVATCLKTAGFDFAMRYYCTSCPCDALSDQEYKELHKAGLKVGVVWEQKHVQTSVAYFTKAHGQADAAAAFYYAKKTIDQPKSTAIYFAVDFDAVQADLVAVEAYFQGIASVANPENYLIGAYGSGYVLETLKGKKLVAKTWLSGSTGWKDYAAYKAKCDILQVFDNGGPFPVCGIEVDENDIAAGHDAGLF